jgi:hypothetical protein
MALLPGGRAIAKTWVSAARTSDQGLWPRMIDYFNEPTSRATRCGRPFSFAISKERNQVMGQWPRRPRVPNARSTNPFDRAGHRSICKCSLLNYFVARGIFAFCLCACAPSLERTRAALSASGANPESRTRFESPEGAARSIPGKRSAQRSLAIKSCTESVHFTKFCTDNHCAGAGKEQRPATKTGSKAQRRQHKRPFAHIWPPNGQTAENRAKLSPPRLHHFELQLKAQHSGALNDNNSVRIALPHLQALPGRAQI